MKIRVNVLPQQDVLELEQGENLLHALRKAGYLVDAPCGGNGTCGKCRLMVDGREVLACRYRVDSDISVALPETVWMQSENCNGQSDGRQCLAAFDIGTTTVVCFLLDAQGRELAQRSMRNPQSSYGADVISRIQWALRGELHALSLAVRKGMEHLLQGCCTDVGVPVSSVVKIGVVGNPCMQQLLLGFPVDNLAAVPFAPVITQASEIPAKDVLPCCPKATMTVVPDISGYVGADTLGCMLALDLQNAADTVLLVDIGTNGEMVLCHKGRMIACATAAGPALEGANISCGMRAAPGAIDHITSHGIHVIGGGEAIGICGSGLIDAAAWMLDNGMLNSRGRILTEDHTCVIAGGVSLTQEDIRQLQLAKGAIAAGIRLMAEAMGITLEEVDRCILAGAFGTYMDAANACRIGLLPKELLDKTFAAGNAAGEGAKLLALHPQKLAQTQELAQRMEFLELASVPGFQRCFAKSMRFPEE